MCTLELQTSYPSDKVILDMSGTPMSFGKFVTVALVCYLVYILFRAYGKLQERKIGTVFQTMSEDTVQESYGFHFTLLD